MYVVPHSWPVQNSRPDCATLPAWSWDTVFVFPHRRLELRIAVKIFLWQLIMKTIELLMKLPIFSREFFYDECHLCNAGGEGGEIGHQLFQDWLLVCCLCCQFFKVSVECLQYHCLCVALGGSSSVHRRRILHCAMHRPKMIFSFGGLLFYHCIFCCCKIGGFPPFPCALYNVKFLPILVGAG